MHQTDLDESLAAMDDDLRRAAVRDWRRDRFYAVTGDAALATVLADDGGIDWHALDRLVSAGCPVLLAATILA